MWRNILILLVLLNVPVSLFVLGAGLLLIYKSAGIVVFALSCVSMFIAVMSVLARFDNP